MKAILALIISAALVSGCKVASRDRTEQKVEYEYVASKFNETANRIQKVEYEVQRIDTFAQGGTVWNNTGTVLIEKDEEDDLFGFSFYGKRHNYSKEYLYDNGNGFVLSRGDSTYSVQPYPKGFLGSPGGQLVVPDIFYLDTVYASAELISGRDAYILKYTFRDDTTYQVTDNTKVIELNKSTFFPTKITRSYKILGDRAVHQVALRDVKINQEAQRSIADYKSEFVDYKLLAEEERQPSNLIGTKLPDISLPNLLNEHQTVALQIDKLTLIDFWEVWCGPCIKSFPEVERIKNLYPTQLQVVGIVSESKEKAIELAKKKGISFLNLIGNKEVLKAYGVDSFPRYFLVDSKGIVRKEYHGFSGQIEEDIKEMLTE